MNASKICNAFAILIGAFLLIEGVWGMFSDMVFSIFSTNKTHATIHIILGLAGLYFGSQGGSKSYCIFLGILLLAVGILHFVPGASDLVTRLINVNDAVAYFNITVGAIALLLTIIPAKESKRK